MFWQDFNPRTHVGCDPTSAPLSRSSSVFQSTHPRGVRLAVPYSWAIPYRISIHAPTWGATHDRGYSESLGQFQSTHPRGVRLFLAGRYGVGANFNPRTHVGCDKFLSHPTLSRLISIHAPTWGATFNSYRHRFISQFQSTHPRGVRHWASFSWIVIGSFQSTHPRGVRRCAFREDMYSPS